MQLAEHGQLRNFATIVRSPAGEEEAIEVSAVTSVEGGEIHHGFSIRLVGRRLVEATGGERQVPRSVEQLTELVGRVSLKEIVRESTDLIERLCIEAALNYTSDNRASAAEILGLSRQSLYSKLHRHGLGNLSDNEG
jgi:transcriptional regulator PpsR